LSTLGQYRGPFIGLVGASISWSVAQALLQIHWTAIRYGAVGHRPLLARAFLGGQPYLLMLVLAAGYILICDEDRKKSAAPYWLGMLVAVLSWVCACFVLRG
jgi:hypothetical protein